MESKKLIFDSINESNLYTFANLLSSDVNVLNNVTSKPILVREIGSASNLNVIQYILHKINSIEDENINYAADYEWISRKEEVKYVGKYGRRLRALCTMVEMGLEASTPAIINHADSRGNTCLHYLGITHCTRLFDPILSKKGIIYQKNLNEEYPHDIAYGEMVHVLKAYSKRKIEIGNRKREDISVEEEYDSDKWPEFNKPENLRKYFAAADSDGQDNINYYDHINTHMENLQIRTHEECLNEGSLSDKSDYEYVNDKINVDLKSKIGNYNSSKILMDSKPIVEDNLSAKYESVERRNRDNVNTYSDYDDKEYNGLFLYGDIDSGKSPKYLGGGYSKSEECIPTDQICPENEIAGKKVEYKMYPGIFYVAIDSIIGYFDNTEKYEYICIKIEADGFMAISDPITIGETYQMNLFYCIPVWNKDIKLRISIMGKERISRRSSRRLAVAEIRLNHKKMKKYLNKLTPFDLKLHECSSIDILHATATAIGALFGWGSVDRDFEQLIGFFSFMSEEEIKKIPYTPKSVPMLKFLLRARENNYISWYSGYANVRETGDDKSTLLWKRRFIEWSGCSIKIHNDINKSLISEINITHLEPKLSPHMKNTFILYSGTREIEFNIDSSETFDSCLKALYLLYGKNLSVEKN